MADPNMIGIGLNAVPHAVNHYHRVWHPVKRNVKKIRSRRNGSNKDNDDSYDDGDMSPEQKGWVLKPRKEVASDEEIVQYVGRKSQMSSYDRALVPRRPGGALERRTSSLDRGSRNYRYGRRGAAGVGGAAAEDSSDDDVDNRSRRGRGQNGARARGNGSDRRDHSTSSSSLISSSEDERQCKSMRRKKWLTAGLATVATIHAAQKVYTSLEARDKRNLEVASGQLSPEDARKKQNRARLQDAAAIGVAALGLKGAYSEWHEMAEQREEYNKQTKEREERHARRLARQQRAKEKGYDYQELLHPHKSGHASQRSKSESR